MLNLEKQPIVITKTRNDPQRPTTIQKSSQLPTTRDHKPKQIHNS